MADDRDNTLESGKTLASTSQCLACFKVELHLTQKGVVPPWSLSNPHPKIPRFNPSQRPVTDSVPTVPAVTTLSKFRPSEASVTGFQFNPASGRRPETGFGGTGPDGSIFPQRWTIKKNLD